MRNPYAEEYQNNMVSWISGKSSHTHERLKSGVLSAIHECWVRGYARLLLSTHLPTSTLCLMYYDELCGNAGMLSLL